MADPSFIPGAPSETRPNPGPEKLGSRVRRFLRAHPILCLFLLTPGIPEYLSGSSSLALLVENPVVFAIFLGFNAGMYLPGALLIREAMVRWKKGWASVLLLGAAYGILEEGVGLSTFFYSKAGPVGTLGYYGHWLGVNWVWLFGILIVHMLMSISIPILLLGLSFPELRGQRLLSDRATRAAVIILGADISVLNIIVGVGYHFWAGPWLLSGSAVAMAGLAYLAYRAPPGLLRAWSLLPRHPPWVFGVVGFAFYPAIVLEEGVSTTRFPPWVAVALTMAIAVVWLWWVLRNVGHKQNERCLIALSAGAIAILPVFGIVSQFRVPIIVGAVVAAIWFFLYLWQKYPPAPPPSMGE